MTDKYSVAILYAGKVFNAVNQLTNERLYEEFNAKMFELRKHFVITNQTEKYDVEVLAKESSG